MNHDELQELASSLSVLIERVTDLTYEALREQTSGNDGYRETEKKLSSVRRSLIKAEATLRSIS
jgi:hypothetical protein